MHKIPVHPRPVPSVPELSSLRYGQRDAIRPEQRQRHARRMPHARVNHPISALTAHRPPKRLARCPIAGLKKRRRRPVSDLAMHRADQFPVICLPRRFGSGTHETLEMPGRFRQRHLEPVPAVPNPKRSVRKPAGPVGRRMGECAHHQRGGGPRDPARHRHQTQIANGIENAGVGLCLRGTKQVPVAGRCDILEQIDRWVDRANDPMRHRPTKRLRHQPPRSASR